MALYVCSKCGGSNPNCLTCWGERYYTPRGTTKEEIPTQRKGPPEEIASSADTTATELIDDKP